MEAQVEQAINIAWDPSSRPELKSQAFEYINQLRADPSGWQVCLSLFVRDPLPSEVVRHVALEVVNSAIQLQKVDARGLEYAKETVRGYIQQRYNSSAAANDPPNIQNKLCQTVTMLFTSLYSTTWSTFFDDFRSLAGDGSNIGISNPQATMFYLRILRSVHDDIADVLIPRSQDEAKRSQELKDLVRRQDAPKIAASWQEILSRWREINSDIVELCLRCIGRWVSWIDISLVVNPEMLLLLWELAEQQTPLTGSTQGTMQGVTVEALTEIVAKKMPPGDKIELIRFLNLADIIKQLLTTPGLADYRNTSKYDTDLGEIVAKLTNTVYFDVVKVLDTDNVNGDIKGKADELLQQTTPFLLRFFSDEYDEICSTVIPSLTDLLTMFRKKVRSGNQIPQHYSQMLQPILDSIVTKMKYDETADWGAEDEGTDEAEFQDLRKRLHVLQQTIAAVDENLFMNTISGIVARTFSSIDSGDQNISWRDLDLALYEMFLFGELAVKSGGLYQKGSLVNAAGQHLVGMLSKMVSSNLAAHPHPAIQLQYLEICVRYCSFFEHNQEYIRPALENFVRFIHSDHPKVRTRSWYLFFRFVKQLRVHLGDDAETVMQSFGDLLQVRAEVPQDKDDDSDSSEMYQSSEDAVFDAQLYLFEAIGCIASTHSIPLEKQTFYARSVLEPLRSDIQAHTAGAGSGDERSILQVHHDIMAIGTLAKGFCEWMPGVSSAGPPPANELCAEFEPASETILSTLESLNTSLHIRTAARFAFTRMLGVLGARALTQLPRWIEGLLSQASSKDEMATFLRLLDQVVFGFKSSISSILDSLLSPLLQRLFTGLSEPTNGTDDEIQLTELKAQYLGFILVILNNELADVLVSPANQATFEPLLNTVEHFCRDAGDYTTARLSFSVLTHMTSVWGGPDVALTNTASGQPNGTVTEPSPALPGFDHFVMTRFSPLVWSLVSAPNFSAKDAHARTALNDAAGLQWTILRKVGPKYEAYLREQELGGVGLQGDAAEEYIIRLRGEQKEWRKWFAGFVGSVRGG